MITKEQIIQFAREAGFEVTTDRGRETFSCGIRVIQRFYQISRNQELAPAGWKLVPVEPTEAMCEAGYLAQDKWPNHSCDNRRELAQSFSEPRWAAMLAAAPEATGINGLTEAETANSMSVRGLSKPSTQGAS
nr:hypothetical protein [uncultured Rhodoferax sp.]